MRPLILPANQPSGRFYRGGARIAEFRQAGPAPADAPEDWVASTTTLFGEDSLGLSRLPGGELLADAIHRNPTAWLGPDHLQTFGEDTALLVKLLDAGQRLPVHAHPDVRFAKERLALGHGKTEAWVFLQPALCTWVSSRISAPTSLRIGSVSRTSKPCSRRCTRCKSTVATLCSCRPACRMRSARAAFWLSCRNRPTCRSCSSGRGSASTDAETATSVWATRPRSARWIGGTQPRRYRAAAQRSDGRHRRPVAGSRALLPSRAQPRLRDVGSRIRRGRRDRRVRITRVRTRRGPPRDQTRRHGCGAVRRWLLPA